MFSPGGISELCGRRVGRVECDPALLEPARQNREISEALAIRCIIGGSRRVG